MYVQSWWDARKKEKLQDVEFGEETDKAELQRQLEANNKGTGKIPLMEELYQDRDVSLSKLNQY